MSNIIKRTIALSLATISICLCGCQKAPEKEAVTSKNNGMLQEKINQTAPALSETQTTAREAEPISIVCSEQFTSTDSSVNFTLNLNKDVAANVEQVIEVAPHFLTEDDIQRVAKVLLGDVEFYERRPSSAPQYSKAQYQQMINRLSPYATLEGLKGLMGANGAETYMEYVQLYIKDWTEAYEKAPEDDPRTPCDWTLKKERHYNDDEVEIGDRAVSDDSDVLFTNVEKDGIEYSFNVFCRDKDDYKNNSISLSLTDGLGLFAVDRAIYRSMLCRTEKPTEAQIHAVKEKVHEMLNEMELGEWMIARAVVETEQIENITEYTIRVSAVPSWNGCPSILGQQVGQTKDSYISEYPMTFAEFQFSANGDIVSFELSAPLDVVAVPNEHVETLPVEELMEKCKQQLSFSEAASYGLPPIVHSDIEISTNQKLRCQVNISDVEYGLGRIMVPESDNHYYYIPVMVFRGTTEYTGDQDGTLYYSNYLSPTEEIPPLLWINAIDGSIIHFGCSTGPSINLSTESQ